MATPKTSDPEIRHLRALLRERNAKIAELRLMLEQAYDQKSAHYHEIERWKKLFDRACVVAEISNEHRAMMGAISIFSRLN